MAGHDTFEPGEVEDFDAYRKARDAAEKPGARLRLFGEVYELPKQIPLAFKVLEERHRDSDDFDSLREVLTPLFGSNALDEWATKGMGHKDFATILAWASENMRRPGSVTLAEAAEAVAAAEAEEGKAPVPANREQRRAAKKGGGKGRKKPASGARF